MIYGNTTDLISYHSARGRVITDDAVTTQALQRASDYIRTRYVIRYGGGDDDENTIEAAYIAAGYEIDTPGFWAKTFTPADQKVLTKVGDIQWTIVGGSNGSDDALPTSPAIDALMLTGTDYGQPVVFTV